MAFPIVPVVVGLVLFAMAGGRKRGTPQPPFLPPSGKIAAAPPGEPPSPPDGDFVPGAPCPAGADEAGGYDEQGNCVIFWNAQTRAAFEQVATEIQAEKGYTLAELCAPDQEIPGEGWVVNPKKAAVIRLALGRLYGMTPQFWPPNDQSPYWIDATWERAMGAMNALVCGYLPGT